MSGESALRPLETAADETDLDVTETGATAAAQSSPQHWSAQTVVLSLVLFMVAGVFEIGGGYLVWIGIKKQYKPELTLVLGSLVLVAYGFIPTLQPVDSFGRTFAVYGGFFIVLSYLWGYLFDGLRLDIGDYAGATISLAGVLLAWFYPR